MVREQIEQAIGPLPHLADPLPQLGEQGLLPIRQTAFIEADPMQLGAAQAADEEISLP
jgi:hypothetical protein